MTTGPILKIGKVKLANPLIMAPLAGITDLPFRLIVKNAGCGLVCSEMISANGLLHQSAKTFRMLNSDEAEKPLSIQIFGADPAIMADAARIVADAGADILDINFGCSVRKVVKTGSGAALMRTPDRAKAILAAVREAISIPLTIKIRSGWDRSGDQAIAIARMAEESGVDAIAVHPRTATQGFGGRADWPLIGRIKQTVRIPVVGNGDIERPDDVIEMFRQTACDGVMIGRTAIGHPWIFSQALQALAGRMPKQVDLQDRQRIMIQYLDASIAYYGETVACRMMRSRLGRFVKGLPHNARFRETIKRIRTRSEALPLIDRYFSESGMTAID
ncbi:MAG: tRNA dihydrouridine synthase DusB [Deltaproteobacteria bacterium]|nr:MAG: tRNA dihydrouridine synthase DusB [Deltaproteobacteria bacterium]